MLFRAILPRDGGIHQIADEELPPIVREETNSLAHRIDTGAQRVTEIHEHVTRNLVTRDEYREVVDRLKKLVGKTVCAVPRSGGGS